MADMFGPQADVRVCDEPPADETKYIPIVSPKPGANVHAVLLGMRFRGVYTHFFQNRTKACLYPTSECEGCRQMLVRRWKAYCPAFMPAAGRMVIVEVTKDAVLHNRVLTTPSRSLRGARITVSRMGTARNGPVRAELDFRARNGELPEPFNLGDALCRVWGLLPQVGRVLALDDNDGQG
jgi:hypothetical protein